MSTNSKSTKLQNFSQKFFLFSFIFKVEFFYSLKNVAKLFIFTKKAFGRSFKRKQGFIDLEFVKICQEQIDYQYLTNLSFRSVFVIDYGQSVWFNDKTIFMTIFLTHFSEISNLQLILIKNYGLAYKLQERNQFVRPKVR